MTKPTNSVWAQRRLSLIRDFAVRMKKAWVLNYPLSALQRLWSDWVDAQAESSLGAQSLCWLCHVTAQLSLNSFLPCTFWHHCTLAYPSTKLPNKSSSGFLRIRIEVKHKNSRIADDTYSLHTSYWRLKYWFGSAAEGEASIQWILRCAVHCHKKCVHQFWHHFLWRWPTSHNENIDISKPEYGSRTKMPLLKASWKISL